MFVAPVLIDEGSQIFIGMKVGEGRIRGKLCDRRAPSSLERAVNEKSLPEQGFFNNQIKLPEC